MSVQSKELEAKNRTIASIFRISGLLTQQIGLDEILRSILISAEKEAWSSRIVPFSDERRSRIS